jgi:hypothetical protein
MPLSRILVPSPEYRQSSGGGATYATWNPLDRFSPNADPAQGNPVLSNGNLTAHAAGGWYAVRATIGVDSGDWFFAITVDVSDNSNTYTMIGVGTGDCGLDYAGNGNPSSWGISSHGYNYYPGGYASNGVTFANGDIMGCSILRSTSQAKFYKYSGGSWSLVYTADISAEDGQKIYPYFSVIGGTGTANFGESAFQAAVPDGCNEGVYE